MWVLVWAPPPQTAGSNCVLTLPSQCNLFTSSTGFQPLNVWISGVDVFLLLSSASPHSSLLNLHFRQSQARLIHQDSLCLSLKHSYLDRETSLILRNIAGKPSHLLTKVTPISSCMATPCLTPPHPTPPSVISQRMLHPSPPTSLFHLLPCSSAEAWPVCVGQACPVYHPKALQSLLLDFAIPKEHLMVI